MTKTCRRCGHKKDLSEYTKDRANKDGLQRYCKDCIRLFRQETKKNKYDLDAIKRCSACKEVKEGSEYYPSPRNRHGLSRYCKECAKAATKVYEARNQAMARPIPATRVCARCKTEKPSSEYYKNSRTSDGLYSACKPCWSDYLKSRRG